MEGFPSWEPWIPIHRVPDASFPQTQQLLLPLNGCGGKSNPMEHFLLPLSLAQLILPCRMELWQQGGGRRLLLKPHALVPGALVEGLGEWDESCSGQGEGWACAGAEARSEFL